MKHVFLVVGALVCSMALSTLGGDRTFGWVDWAAWGFLLYMCGVGLGEITRDFFD